LDGDLEEQKENEEDQLNAQLLAADPPRNA